MAVPACGHKGGSESTSIICVIICGVTAAECFCGITWVCRPKWLGDGSKISKGLSSVDAGS